MGHESHPCQGLHRQRGGSHGREAELLSTTTQEALKQLAWLGNVAEVATLTLVHGETEEEIHTALWEAVRTGLILRREESYAFLHDRIQEAAYTLIPEGERAGAHLRIGRMLLASMTADGLAEHLFDVANQLNRGAELLIDRGERVQVAAIDLRAGRKAKASAAYASARAYFSAGISLLDDRAWDSQYELTFSLWLERAQAEAPQIRPVPAHPQTNEACGCLLERVPLCYRA